MKNKFVFKVKSIFSSTHFGFFLVLILMTVSLFFLVPEFFSSKISSEEVSKIVNIINSENEKVIPIIKPLDKEAYDEKMEELANNPPDPIVYKIIKTVEVDKNGKSIIKTEKVPLDPQPIKTHLWPVKTIYPNDGAILPFNRIVAYYGNLYSKNMGVLGQYEEGEMLQRLDIEVKKWEIADPKTPVIPALHYIAVVAQGSEGKDGKYRSRMPDSEIDKVIEIARKINAIVFLDIQVGFSDLQTEVPRLLKYLKMPKYI